MAAEKRIDPCHKGAGKRFYSISVAMFAALLSGTALATASEEAQLAAQGFSISMEAPGTATSENSPAQISEPVKLGPPAKVQVNYKGINPVRSLRTFVRSEAPAYKPGATITITTESNYPAFIQRAELRVLKSGGRGDELLETLVAPVNGSVDWVLPELENTALTYVFRVYDEQGRYDETFARPFFSEEAAFETSELPNSVNTAMMPGVEPGTIRQRYIPIEGGVVAVSGRADPDQPVKVMGETVPVDDQGEFSVTRNLPVGTALVEVDFSSQGEAKSIIRPVEIPASQWHYVGIIDITAGHRLQDDQAENTPDFERNYVDGRAAYYISGKTGNGWAITSSADTGEGDIEDIFRRLDEKDPEAILDRLSDDDLYPTYGDDSSSYDDTPTSGRVYLRAEKGDTSALWGDFKADLSSGGLINNTRELYGAKVRTALPSRTKSGKARLSGVVYAAQPDTLPQTDILRGTGGSIYFLSRQDVNGQSENVTVEVLDPDTGRVIATRSLQAGVDYSLNYLQGVISLAEPLGSSSSIGSLVPSAGGDYDVNLVVQYEYTPAVRDVDGFSLGGRAESWLTDHLRLGATGMKEGTGTADQKMFSTDLRVEWGERSFLEAEVAQTEGPGFGRTVSSDGGLTLTDEAGAEGERARAYRVDGSLDFEDFNLQQKGTARFYLERIEAGFATLNRTATHDQLLVGGETSIDVSSATRLRMAAENYEEDGGDRKRSAEVIASHKLSESWSVDAGVEYEDKKTLGEEEETGRRTDVSSRLTYSVNDDARVWLLGQVTADVTGGLDRDDRYGAGGEWQLNDKLLAAAEVTEGTTGLGATGRLTYKQTDDREMYVGYTLDPTRTVDGYDLIGEDKGKIVVGARTKHSEKLSSFGETAFDLFGDRYSSTRTVGATYQPSEPWNFSGSVESGLVRDRHNGDIDRDAFSIGVSYKTKDSLSAHSRFEYRRDRGDDQDEEADTYALKAGLGYRGNENARLLGSVNALISDNLGNSFRDGEYVKATLGYAIRPTLSEQFNMLFKYSYLHDLPGADQVTVDGSTEGDKQKSHVISVDADYDLTQQLTLGGKYGYRISQVAERGTNDFEDSSAHLGILRLNWHVVKNWDAMVEGRLLYGVETDTVSTGALAGVYRHIGDHLKVGVGYEWGTVSDDLTDLNYTNSGVFLNLIAKM
ncbi:TonB-dependent receptor [Pseudovibrio exalbescens]|uniref:Uncharacterized protein n=1 Tax=Pseudovibrio exalbescens TaxID=197461 RepID=A0A1U7JGL9_9HYPH|nr:hypothetical protein [Pseudovibrio exalbescens]OKL43791.1 hypothetical protein A3843_11780 [Pseudovibrio exalbescens]